MGLDDLVGADDSLVYALYDGLLGRAPDPAGLVSWMGHVSGLDTLHDVIERFLKSTEGRARHDGLDDRGFVNKLYEDNLHRGADDAGMAYWTDQLRHGVEREDVARGILLADEHLAHLKGVFEAGDVARLYYGLLGRVPDAGGLHAWRDAIEHGASLHEVAQGFLGSTEYQGRAAGLGNAAYIDDLYLHALGRHADDPGSRGWVDALEHGASRASIAAVITDSVEAHHHLVAQVEQAWHI
ncbi:DUF4214 domain-containing protein [Methylobacterium oxalidis]|uniref:DUF4214 domain-containing protein n=1 Tax=Methylobacterium oxalidis TaxID=944322 RepID=A0A512JCE0_9HYPH|nr:DUF4214 domain-containing protein [Methylobacterium oxalidis]GEP07575.1 hypothetical protein MOX02_56130 [Methylobacterium oxalidis]GJE34683.1 hypothetical protein LDDCCGHA_4896 [Methylobacterium oxalidis]GLS64443.1 hypothetical protein GCM10007888_28240 [Methylobacterium oxalidis]